MITSGDGLIYNVTRAKMLTGAFRWTDQVMFGNIVDTSYAYSETHKTFADVAAQITDQTVHGLSKLTSLFVSANGWAGSDPAAFANEVWTMPIGSFIITRFIGPSIGPDGHELVACLNVFLGGPIYPDGSPFNLTFDQSNGQQGWFRP